MWVGVVKPRKHVQVAILTKSDMVNISSIQIHVQERMNGEQHVRCDGFTFLDFRGLSVSLCAVSSTDVLCSVTARWVRMCVT